MNNIYISRVIRFLVLIAIQVMVLNNVHIAGYFTPLFIGYMLIRFETGSSRTGLLMWGFTIGILNDIFCNTAGMASSACTLLAMMQPRLLSLFAPRDSGTGFEPSVKSMGFGKYINYTLLSMFLLHSVYYALDAFTLSNWQLTLTAIIGSTVLTTVLCVLTELCIRKR